MAQSNSTESKGGAANPFAGDFMKLGGMPMEALVGMQKQLVETFEQVNRDRFARAQQEVELVSAFAGKLSGARSMADVLGVYQDWVAKRMEMLSEDSKKLFEDTQKVFNATTKMLSNGGSGGAGGGT